MDPALLFFIVAGAALGIARPRLSTEYLTYLYLRCPKNALRMERKGESEKAIRHLEWVLSRRTKVPEIGRVTVRTTLAGMYRRAHRFPEAEAQFRSALSGWQERKTGLGNVTVEAEIRFDLAQTLEALGDKTGAETEYDMSAQCLVGAEGKDWSWHLLRARGLSRRGQQAEAITEYKIALHDMPASIPAYQRGAEMLNLAICLLGTERTTDSISYLQKAIDCSLGLEVLPDANLLLGLQYLGLNRLGDAKSHYETAIETNNLRANPETNRKNEILQRLIGETHLWAGSLDAARQTADLLARGGTRTGAANAELLVCNLDSFAGDFSGALRRIQTLRRFRCDEDPFFRSQIIPPEMDFALSLMAADLYVSLNEPEKALVELEAALPTGEGAARWSWDAVQIRVLSQLRNEGNAAQRTELEARTLGLQRVIESDFTRRLNEGAQPADAAATLRQITNSLAYTTFALGMYTQSLQLSLRYLEMSPYAVLLPGTYCLIGDCQAALGRKKDACDAWQAAVSFGIDTYRARIAGQRLTDRREPA